MRVKSRNKRVVSEQSNTLYKQLTRLYGAGAAFFLYWIGSYVDKTLRNV